MPSQWEIAAKNSLAFHTQQAYKGVHINRAPHDGGAFRLEVATPDAAMNFATLPPRWQASSDFAYLATLGQGLLDSIELSRTR